MGTIWKPSDGYFGNLLAALRGQAMVREPGLLNAGGNGGLTVATGGRPVTPDTALKQTAVWAAAKLGAEAFGSMPVNVYRRKKDGSRELYNDHWLWYLLNISPNRYQTANEFKETISLSLDLCGNFYGRKAMAPGSDEEIASVLPLMPGQMEVELMQRGERVYKYTDGRDVGVFSQSTIWHLPLMPTNAVVGLSPIEYGARMLGIAEAAENRVATFAANGFKPTGVLMFDRVLSKDQRDKLKVQFADLAEGAGDPLRVLEAGMKYQQVSISPKDAQLLESREFTVQDVGRLFGTPSILLNDTSGTSSWGTGISEIKRGYFTLNLRPKIERVEASIVKWLLPPGERRSIIVEFDFSAFVSGDDKERTEWQGSAVKSNLLTINEARALEGRPGIGPKGDVMYNQAQMIPLGERETENVTPPAPAD